MKNKVRKNKIGNLSLSTSPKKTAEKLFSFTAKLWFQHSATPMNAIAANAIGRNASVTPIDCRYPPRSTTNNIITTSFCLELLRILSTPNLPSAILFILEHIFHVFSLRVLRQISKLSLDAI